MWQHHYVIHMMRMDELRAEADRERLLRMQDLADARRLRPSTPGPGRALVARGIAALSRGTARAARRLDARVAVDLGPERLARDV